MNEPEKFIKNHEEHLDILKLEFGFHLPVNMIAKIHYIFITTNIIQATLYNNIRKNIKKITGTPYVATGDHFYTFNKNGLPGCPLIPIQVLKVLEKYFNEKSFYKFINLEEPVSDKDINQSWYFKFKATFVKIQRADRTYDELSKELQQFASVGLCDAIERSIKKIISIQNLPHNFWNQLVEFSSPNLNILSGNNYLKSLEDSKENRNYNNEDSEMSSLIDLDSKIVINERGEIIKLDEQYAGFYDENNELKVFPAKCVVDLKNKKIKSCDELWGFEEYEEIIRKGKKYFKFINLIHVAGTVRSNE